MSATGPANIGWRPSVLSAMILPVGPLVTAATARAPPANAAPIGVRIGLPSAVDQRPNGRSTRAIAPLSRATALHAGSTRTSGPERPFEIGGESVRETRCPKV